MGDSVTGLRSAAGPKLDCLPPHGMPLRVAILQRNDPAEHDVDTRQHLQRGPKEGSVTRGSFKYVTAWREEG